MLKIRNLIIQKGKLYSVERNTRRVSYLLVIASRIFVLLLQYISIKGEWIDNTFFLNIPKRLIGWGNRKLLYKNITGKNYIS